jgi:hypothetical protein
MKKGIFNYSSSCDEIGWVLSRLPDIEKRDILKIMAEKEHDLIRMSNMYIAGILHNIAPEQIPVFVSITAFRFYVSVMLVLNGREAPLNVIKDASCWEEYFLVQSAISDYRELRDLGAF